MSNYEIVPKFSIGDMVNWMGDIYKITGIETHGTFSEDGERDTQVTYEVEALEFDDYDFAEEEELELYRKGDLVKQPITSGMPLYQRFDYQTFYNGAPTANELLDEYNDYKRLHRMFDDVTYLEKANEVLVKLAEVQG